MNFSNGESLFTYIINNGLGYAQDSKKMAINSCGYFLSQIQNDEELKFVFIANAKPEKSPDIIGAIWGITNKRLIVTKKKLMGDFSQNISLESINDITCNKSGLGKFGLANITIDTIRENIVASTNIRYGDAIYNGLKIAFDEAVVASRNKNNIVNVVQKTSAEQIKEFKELLDCGIITQEEFDAKKKELLGL